MPMAVTASSPSINPQIIESTIISKALMMLEKVAPASMEKNFLRIIKSVLKVPHRNRWEDIVLFQKGSHPAKYPPQTELPRSGDAKYT